jgi:hypothetical protein
LKQVIDVSGETPEARAIMNTEVWGPSPDYKTKPVEGFNVKMHPRAADKGGVILPDDGDQGPRAFKTMLA